MTGTTLSGDLGRINDAQYKLKTSINISVGMDGRGYSVASYEPLGLKGEDVTENRAIDALKTELMQAHHRLSVKPAYAFSPESRAAWEHLSRILVRTTHDPRDLEAVISKK